VATPSEITAAIKIGLNILKFFPAQALGGVATLKAISRPFVGVKFIPTGGINPNNLGNYHQLDCVHACGGSWLVKKLLIQTGQFEEITRLTKEAVQLIQDTRAK
jgi:2-dehydro-3-deoxyphosphogluconate aldolase/(4S)-4-hydroxy-2-oxoglutarate aldolase